MFFYRLLISIFSLLVLTKALWARDFTTFKARLGLSFQNERHCNGTASRRPTIWLHAASNGELASARDVLHELGAQRPDVPILITCNSKSGIALAQSWGFEARLAPLDLSWVSKRVMAKWNILAHITLEKEIWPHRLRHCPGPVIVLGGAISEKTATFWSRIPGLSPYVFGLMSGLSAQSDQARIRFVKLGVRPTAILADLDLKSLFRRPEVSPEQALETAFNRDRTWLAVSTHQGDEAIILEAHQLARDFEPDLRLILVPRHPARGDDVGNLIDAAGFDYARRSLREDPDASVYLADTFGETPLWYHLAGRVFIGGTLSDRGGHTPFEPSAFGCALIYGPDMRNFESASRRLVSAGITPTATPEEISGVLRALSHPKDRHSAAQRAQNALKQDTDLPALISNTLALLPQPQSYE